MVSASTTVTFEHYRDTILDTRMVFDMLAGALQRILATLKRGSPFTKKCPLRSQQPTSDSVPKVTAADSLVEAAGVPNLCVNCS